MMLTLCVVILDINMPYELYKVVMFLMVLGRYGSMTSNARGVREILVAVLIMDGEIIIVITVTMLE